MKIIFSFCQDDIPIDCEMNEKLKVVFQRYLRQTQLNIPVYILYNGTKLDLNSNQTMDEIINTFDKQRKQATILVYRNEMVNEEDNVNVNIKAKTSREETQKQKNNELRHSYWNHGYNNTNEQINIYNNLENNNYLNSLNQNEMILVNFKFNGIYHPLKASKLNIMKEVCTRFAENEEKKINYFKFYYRGNIVDQNKRVGEFFHNNNNDGITINVEDNTPCYIKHKTKLIAIGSVVIGAIILAIIVIVSKATENKNKSTN